MTALSEWVGLKEACRILGVHETTLRRWTDQGLIVAFRTPGGHRRYLRQELLAFLERGRALALQAPAEPLERLQQRALAEAHQILAHRLVEEPWTPRYDSVRPSKRANGRQLLGLLIQYAARGDQEQAYLQAARAIMRQYGREALQLGLSIPETARAVLTFRQVIMEAVAHSLDRPPAHDPEGWRVMERAGIFFDELLVATLEGYLQGDGSGGAQPGEAMA
ncbi:helix-turn-helix domain-containing protein [Geochorda subterranea]|uniref:Helix-turn-helix domain-containing protein n=1 Tax=Geochorda subterranea TaxID=3109564 RepID=A0ABZ1BQT5_9FIRM|nr:helix-turn-helix domain-containing protein [Limnochorda sp. LNt]WRP14946.1 helix-turn-helix domain-containing protein [Limnochorda sp. LNt]